MEDSVEKGTLIKPLRYQALALHADIIIEISENLRSSASSLFSQMRVEGGFSRVIESAATVWRVPVAEKDALWKARLQFDVSCITH
jgi:hypothetical protein